MANPDYGPAGGLERWRRLVRRSPRRQPGGHNAAIGETTDLLFLLLD